MTQTSSAPNLYLLIGAGIGGSIHITYTPSDNTGKPDLVYVDPTRNLKYNGTQIITENSKLGTVVTVTLPQAAGTSGFTTFSLVVPTIYLGALANQPFKTIAIVTNNDTTHQELNIPGPTQVYQVINLEGSAQII